MIHTIDIMAIEKSFLTETQQHYMEFSFGKLKGGILRQTTPFMKCRELFGLLPIIDMLSIEEDIEIYNYNINDGYLSKHTKDTTILLLKTSSSNNIIDKLHYINDLEKNITQINKVTKSIKISKVINNGEYIALETPLFWRKNSLTLTFYALFLRCLLVLPSDKKNIKKAFNSLVNKSYDIDKLEKLFNILDLPLLFNNIDTIVKKKDTIKEFEEKIKDYYDDVDYFDDDIPDMCVDYLYSYTTRGIQSFLCYVTRQDKIEGISENNKLFKHWLETYMQLVKKSNRGCQKNI